VDMIRTYNIQNSSGLWFTYSKFFIKPDELESIMLSKAEEENFEEAAGLQEMMKNLLIEK